MMPTRVRTGAPEGRAQCCCSVNQTNMCGYMYIYNVCVYIYIYIYTYFYYYYYYYY